MKMISSRYIKTFLALPLMLLISPGVLVGLPRLPANRGTSLLRSGRAWDAASAVAPAVRLANISKRATSAGIRESATNLNRMTIMSNPASSIPLRGISTGSISVAKASLERRATALAARNAPVIKNPGFATGTTSYNLRSSGAQNMRQAAELKKLPAQALSPKIRSDVGAAIQQAEKNAATANSIARKFNNKVAEKEITTPYIRLNQRANNLEEQIVLSSAMRVKTKAIISGANLKQSTRLEQMYGGSGWGKMQHLQRMSDGRQITVHWFQNSQGARKEFKFTFRKSDKEGLFPKEKLESKR